MKNCLFFFVILCQLNCNSNATREDVSDSMILSMPDFEGPENMDILKIYADSINLLKPEDNFPFFLANECFDYQPYLWKDNHHPVSLRILVVNNVTNKAAISRILDSHRFTSICKIQKDTINRINNFVVPNIDKSFADLFKMRLNELTEQ